MYLFPLNNNYCSATQNGFLWDMHLFHKLASVQTFGDRYDYGDSSHLICTMAPRSNVRWNYNHFIWSLKLHIERNILKW